MDERKTMEVHAICEHALQLGIDPTERPDLLWVAEDSLLAQLPHPWAEYTDEYNQRYYFNKDTQESAWENPTDEHFKQLAKKLLSEPPNDTINNNAEHESRHMNVNNNQQNPTHLDNERKESQSQPHQHQVNKRIISHVHNEHLNYNQAEDLNDNRFIVQNDRIHVGSDSQTDNWGVSQSPRLDPPSSPSQQIIDDYDAYTPSEMAKLSRKSALKLRKQMEHMRASAKKKQAAWEQKDVKTQRTLKKVQSGFDKERSEWETKYKTQSQENEKVIHERDKLKGRCEDLQAQLECAMAPKEDNIVEVVENKDKIVELRKEHDETIEELRTEHANTIESLEEEIEKLRTELSSTCVEREELVKEIEDRQVEHTQQLTETMDRSDKEKKTQREKYEAVIQTHVDEYEFQQRAHDLVRQEHINVCAQVKVLQETCDEYSKQNENLTAKLSETQKQFENITSTMKQNQVSAMREETELRPRLTQQQALCDSLTDQITELSSSLRTKEMKLLELDSELLKEKRAKQDLLVQIQTLEARETQSGEDMSRTTTELSEARKRIEKLKSMSAKCTSLESRLEEQTLHVVKQREKEEVLKNEVKESVVELKKVENQFEQLKREKNTLNRQTQGLIDKVTRLESKLNETHNRSMEAASSRGGVALLLVRDRDRLERQVDELKKQNSELWITMQQTDDTWSTRTAGLEKVLTEMKKKYESEKIFFKDQQTEHNELLLNVNTLRQEVQKEKERAASVVRENVEQTLAHETILKDQDRQVEELRIELERAQVSNNGTIVGAAAETAQTKVHAMNAKALRKSKFDKMQLQHKIEQLKCELKDSRNQIARLQADR